MGGWDKNQSGTEVQLVYGFGQSSGSLSQWAAPGCSTGIDSGTPHTPIADLRGELDRHCGRAWPSNGTSAAFCLETGTYTGAPPAFVLNSGNPSGDGVNVFTSSVPVGSEVEGTASQAATTAATVSLDTIALTSATPEPTSMMLLGLGAGGLMLRRRRSRKAAETVA